MFVVESGSDSARMACCLVAFIFVFILMIMAICWTNRENFESFNNNIKYSNETVKNVLGGGFHYKALTPQDDILKKLKGSKKPTLIAILAPWCGYCKSLKESGTLRKVANKFPVLTMDDQHPQTQDIMHLIQAKGFPALGIYHKGELLPYDGPREDRHLIGTLKSMSNRRENFTSGGIKELPESMSKMEYDSLLKSKPTKVCTIFMADWCGYCKQLKSSGTLEKLADSGVTVLTANDKSRLAKEMKLKDFQPCIVPVGVAM